MGIKKAPAAPSAPAALIYCDKIYAQRSLLMPNGRELKVQRGRLVVQPDDDEARQYLDARRDFEALSQEG
ncbi:hypothetical protein [Pseudomonas fulva]|uniref:hypothetical protein n=1 Tax=Pseudomonas fulva TaxID=47880 RepID=UPI002480B086|nr:hypothetical protein [Pseudomonas fulva]